MKKLKTTFSAFETEQPQIEILKYNKKYLKTVLKKKARIRNNNKGVINKKKNYVIK